MSPCPTPSASAVRTQLRFSNGSSRTRPNGVVPVQFPVSIELHRSRFLSFLLVLSHALAFACVFVLPWPWRLPLLALIGVSFWRAWRPSLFRVLCLCGADRLDCCLLDGSRAALEVQADSTVFRLLIVLRLRIGDEKRISSLTLLPDQMSGEQFRALRLWLRWHAEPKKDAGTSS